MPRGVRYIVGFVVGIAAIIFQIARENQSEPDYIPVVGGSISFEVEGGNPADPCHGSGDLADLEPNSTVQILDEEGTAIGLSGYLIPGQLVQSNNAVNCEMSFVLYDVARSDRYQVVFGNGRSEAYTQRDIERNNDQIKITVD